MEWTLEQVAMELSEPLAVVSLGRDGLPIEPGRRGLSPNPGKPAFAVKMQDLHYAARGWVCTSVSSISVIATDPCSRWTVY